MARGSAIRGSRTGAGRAGKSERCVAWTRTPSRPPDSTAQSKSHLAYVRDRRSDADAEQILSEALAQLRGAS